MLKTPAPFPYVGSHALIEHDGEIQLARILAWRATNPDLALIGFPLREGASGNIEAHRSQLLDATPLTASETREFHDLDRAQAAWTDEGGRLVKRLTPKQKAERARRDGLRQRIIHGPILDRLLRFAAAAERNRQFAQRRAA